MDDEKFSEVRIGDLELSSGLIIREKIVVLEDGSEGVGMFTIQKGREVRIYRDNAVEHYLGLIVDDES